MNDGCQGVRLQKDREKRNKRNEGETVIEQVKLIQNASMIELDLEKLTAPSSGHVVDEQNIQHGLYSKYFIPLFL